jgi:hypothetical protein
VYSNCYYNWINNTLTTQPGTRLVNYAVVAGGGGGGTRSGGGGGGLRNLFIIFSLWSITISNSSRWWWSRFSNRSRIRKDLHLLFQLFLSSAGGGGGIKFQMEHLRVVMEVQVEETLQTDLVHQLQEVQEILRQ